VRAGPTKTAAWIGWLWIATSVSALSAQPTDSAQPTAAAIEQAVRSESRLRVHDWIEYQIDGSRVTLTGSVSMASLKPSIAARVARVQGVEQVEDQIVAAPYSRDDMAMRVNAYWRIYGNAELRRYARQDGPVDSQIARDQSDRRYILVKPIHILVDDGHIRLEGEVEQERDRLTAEQGAQLVMGVQSVENRLVVVGENTAEHQAAAVGADPWWTENPADPRPSLRIDNPGGRTVVYVSNTERIRVRSKTAGREIRDGDTATDRSGRRTRIRARPQDGALIDLEIDLPYGYGLEVESVDGAIELIGLLRDARVKTATGAVHLEAPWDLVRLDVVCQERPPLVEAADVAELGDRPRLADPEAVWRLTDERPKDVRVYGRVEVEGQRPKLLRITPGAVPEDSPVHLHAEAPNVLARLFKPADQRRLHSRAGVEQAEPEGGSGATFSSDVRLVDLTVSVVDAGDQPVGNLRAGDFRVTEEGVQQTVRIVEGEATPFNLVLLLDLSTSTLDERFTLVQAARRFVGIARPKDRVAVHVLSDGFLQVLSPLTDDHASLLERLDDIPPLSGSTPLYDALVLSYAQEFSKRRFERNALIVISDGMDNQILPNVGRRTPSKTPYEDLLRAAREMQAVLYPVFLDGAQSPGVEQNRRWRAWRRQAREQLEALAKATGGRLFQAPSFRALTPVYAQVADELRSIYRIAYYPRNQSFDGEWRSVEVTVDRPGVRLRTRPGYYAR